MNSVKQNKSTQTNTSNDSSDADSAAVGRVLGAFAKAAEDNPNDTSAADLTMKSLGNIVGGGGVSAADSAKAIAMYKAASGGGGTYYEYTIETTTKQFGNNKSITKFYLANNGEGRSDMNIASMMGAKNSSGIIILGRADQPNYSMTLDDEEKSYSLNVIDTDLINNKYEKYQVTKLGTENISGYNCTHAKVTSTMGSGMFKSTTAMDVWLSADVPGYSVYKKALVQNVTPAMMKALSDAGCSGFLVKMSSNSKDYSMNMQLSKAEKQTFAASLFKIPSDYKESADNLMIGNMMHAAQKQ